jgi:hypothetical protein
MRTKTLALSALLGAIGAVSAVAQTNVYSINAVGYINVTLYPGYNIVTCPLVCSPDNTIATLLNNTNGQYQIGSGHAVVGATVFQYINGIGYVAGDTASKSGVGGWQFNGTNTILPGQAIWFLNPAPIGTGPTSSNMLATFVGTVPQSNNYNMTNTLYPGYNLVGSVIPVSGDLITNNISEISTNAATGTLASGPVSGDTVFVYDPTYNPATTGQGGYSTGQGGVFSVSRQGIRSWTQPDPATTYVYQGFWYLNNTNFQNNWVENFTINP